MGLLALPDLADQPQPALDRAQGTAQAGGDLRGRVALHLPHRDGLQVGVAQPAQQQAGRLGHLGGELRRRLPAGELVQPPRRRVVGAEQPRLAQDGPAAALLAALGADQVGGLALGEGDEQPPQVVAVGQAGEAAVLGGAAEAGEGGKRHVLLVGGAARLALELGPGQADQAVEVALPQPLGGGRVAFALEQAQPVGNRLVAGHGPNVLRGTQRCQGHPRL